MAQIGTVTGSSVIGAQRNTFGTFSRAGDVVTGHITTGLNYINWVSVSPSSTPADSTHELQVEINTDESGTQNGSMKLTAAANALSRTGVWSAVGYGGG